MDLKKYCPDVRNGTTDDEYRAKTDSKEPLAVPEIRQI